MVAPSSCASPDKHKSTHGYESRYGSWPIAMIKDLRRGHE
jgi:hypothetical protein